METASRNNVISPMKYKTEYRRKTGIIPNHDKQQQNDLLL